MTTIDVKYKFTGETLCHGDVKLKRIVAVRNFSGVKEGDLGGWIEDERNLSHHGNAWVYDDAWVSDNAWVYGNARVYDDARVSDNARVSDDAWVSDDARVYGNA